MKVLDKYILKSFLKPFFATFFIILFVLVMQALWQAFDSFAGKGITTGIILKFLGYTLLLITPMAIPIGILLSSIMTLGGLSERYEFAAAKSAGISLQRFIRPLIFLVLFLSAVNFVFLDYVYPYAVLKQINLKMNIKKKQPSLALVPGSFNTEIPNFQIKFDEKYGEKGNLLKNVIIYDLSARKGNNKIITAKNGEFISEEGSRYMTLTLKDGHFFEHHISSNTSYKRRQKMPASYADFDEYTINVDVSELMKDDLSDENYTRNFNMLSLKQLKDTLPTMKINYDEYVNGKAKALGLSIYAKKLYQNDTLTTKKLDTNILNNFNAKNKLNILKGATSKVERTLKNMDNNRGGFKTKRKILNHYDIEFYNRIALSLSCLLLFFIGAPLGSIIRKGGMGLPMVFAIMIYLIYHFSNTLGKNMAEESSISAIVGSWIATFLMLPFAIIFTRGASKDKNFEGVFSIALKALTFGKDYKNDNVENLTGKELTDFYFNKYTKLSNIALIMYLLSGALIGIFSSNLIILLATSLFWLLSYITHLVYSISYYEKVNKTLNNKINATLYVLIAFSSPLYFVIYFFMRRELKSKISEYYNS